MHRPMHIVALSLLAPLAGVGVANAQEASRGPSSGEVVAPRIEQADPSSFDEEMAWFREVLGRSEARSDSFRSDVLAGYEVQRAEQVDAIKATYETTIGTLERQTRDLRGDAIRKFEAFLRRHDDVRATSEVRLRLAELEFQEANDRWLDESDAFNDELQAAGDDFDKIAELQERGSPQLELDRVVALLTGLVEANEGLPREEQYPLLDVAYYMLAYVYYNPNAAQFDKAYAQDVFQDLIDARPDSAYADAAHLLRGRYLFTDLGDLDGAVAEFQAVIDKGPDGDWFADAKYYLAWARYKQYRYEEALLGFQELLELSEDEKARTGRGNEYAPEAVTYIGLTLLDEANEANESVLVRANRYFASIGDVPWAWEVYVQLAGALETYSRYEEAVEVYRYLQDADAYKFRPENPEFQDKVVKLLERGYGADLEAAGQARIDMTQRYGEGSDWWDANRADPEALATARGYIETYLLDVAIEFRVRAQEQNDPALYAKAAEQYDEYLTKFPVSDSYFENQFYLADSLYRAGQLAPARTEFASLVRNARFHEYDDISVYQLARVDERVVSETVGPFDQHVEGAGVERVETLASGTEMPIYALTPEQKQFQESVDRAVSWDYGEPLEDLGVDVADLVAQTGHQLQYFVAQMLYYGNRFDEARPRLMAIIDGHPDTLEASYAATLYVNSWTMVEDYAEVRRWSREFSTRRLGPSDSDNSAFFRNALEQSTYELGVQAFKAKDYATAADAFLDFAKEFPKSEKVPDALISASSAYTATGRIADANEIIADFLKKYPRHEEAPAFYLRLAENFGATFQLAEAITYYQNLIDRFPTHKNAAIATYMIAFLKEGTGDHLGAAQGYEAYASKFKDQPDRESVHFRAGSQYELVSADRAIAFYTRYLKEYGVTNPDHALEAQALLAKLYEDKGKTRDATKATDALIPLFAKAAEGDKPIGPRARDLAAAAAFRDVEKLYNDFVPDDILDGDFEKLADFLFKGGGEGRLVELVEACDNLINTYASFEYTTAAIYLKGAAAADFADVGYGVQPPPEYTGPQLDAFWNLLEQTVYPRMDEYQTDAKTFLQKVLELATSQKRHSVWVDKARQRLNRIDPANFPAGKDAIVSDGRVEAVPSLPLVKPAADDAKGEK